MYRIGVDLGGTNIAAGLVDENYNIIKKLSVPTNASRGAEAIVADISALCLKLCEESGIAVEDIDAVGVATPGIADHTNGYAEYANNLPFDHVPICEMVTKATGIKEAHVENDANAAAWGEAVAGAAKGADTSVMITLGTGVGGGIVIDGNNVYSGFNYAGAELGHIVIEHNGKPCSCGRRGCWEAYSSATGLIKMTKEKLEECEKNGETTVMTELVAKKGKVTGRTAFDAMRLGDKAGTEVVDMYLDYLACGLATVISIFKPQIITIGGGISGEGQSLVDALEPRVRAYKHGGDTEIRIAKLGNDAGIIGAAFLGI